MRLEADVADVGNRIGGLEKESRTRDEQGDKITAALATLEKRMDDLVQKENGGGGASATTTEAVDGKIVREATERTVERQLRDDRAIEDRKKQHYPIPCAGVRSVGVLHENEGGQKVC